MQVGLGVYPLFLVLIKEDNSEVLVGIWELYIAFEPHVSHIHLFLPKRILLLYVVT